MSTPTLNRPIDDLIAEYKREFLRTNGREVTVETTKSNFWIYIDGSPFRRRELPNFIARLKERPNHTTSEPVPNHPYVATTIATMGSWR